MTTTRHFLGTVAIDMSSGAFASTTDLIKTGGPSPEINFDLVHISPRERRIYGLIQAIGAYGPASGELFEVTLEISALA